VERTGRLAGAFVDELAGAPGRAPAGGGADAASLEAELAAACARGRAALPALAADVDDEAFARHLARALAHDGTGGSLATLAVEDLYLACACLAGAGGAAAELRARHGGVIRAAIARVVHGADAADVEQQLLDGLLVGSAGGAPKIGTYAGQAPLGRWLQVAAQRAALMHVRGGQAEARARDGAAAEVIAEHALPEVGYIGERYRRDFEDALRDALGRVTERQRVLLRLHLVNGLSVESIGKMFGVSQSTASRWLAAVRESLLADVKAALQARLGATSGELVSLVNLVASRLDMSLSQILKTMAE
jgi:RNA polymerase sigma-70 factor (ECF subfamily)